MYHDETYSKKALIPLWIIHSIFIFLFISVLAVDMMEVAGELDGFEQPALSAFMFFFCVALIFEPLEMVLHSYRYLEPWLYLSLQVYKSLLSTIFFVYEIYGDTQRGEHTKGIWMWVWILILALCACTMVSYYASLIYGTVVLRRHHKLNSDWEFVDSGEKGDE